MQISKRCVFGATPVALLRHKIGFTLVFQIMSQNRTTHFKSSIECQSQNPKTPYRTLRLTYCINQFFANADHDTNIFCFFKHKQPKVPKF